MSIKISEAFGKGSPDIWFNIQNDYDFWQASQDRTQKSRAAAAGGGLSQSQTAFRGLFRSRFV
jgi:plasmid maintenance system antidote protein VapI